MDFGVKDEKIIVSLELEVHVLEFPKSYRELAKKMEVAIDRYYSLICNKEISFFFLATSAYLLRPGPKHGDYFTFKAQWTQAILLRTYNLEPCFPIRWSLTCEDIGLKPSVMMDFQLEIVHTVMSVDDFSAIIDQKLPDSMKSKGKEINYHIFDNFDFGVMFIDDDIIVTKKEFATPYW